MPTCDDLAMLVVGDFSLDTYKCDITVQANDHTLSRVSSLHPTLMALQYPLLFPHSYYFTWFPTLPRTHVPASPPPSLVSVGLSSSIERRGSERHPGGMEQR